DLDGEGRLFVHSRRTDLIVTGGENVYPIEIEHALEATPGVRRAIVFGEPDAKWGQRVAAAIEIDTSADARVILADLATRLATHKRPRRVAIVDELATTASGKLDRKDTLARYCALLEDVAP